MILLALAGAAQPAQSGGDVHIVVIGVDGLSVDGVARTASPNLHRLMERGAWTLEARGVLPTLSSPNWASAITGAGPEQHGITSNGYLRRMVEFRPVCQGRDGKFPTIFDVLRSARPASKIAVFHDWGGLSSLIERQAPDVMRHEHGAERTTAAAIRYWMENRPHLLFIHLDNLDHAGHAHGWGSAAYYRSVEEADVYIGRVMEMVDRSGAAGTTYLLLTSDHGGTPRGHGKNSLAEIQIPWILAGPGVAAGRIAAPVNTFDTAVTIAWILDLTPPPCWIGRAVTAAFRSDVLAARDRAGRGETPACRPERTLPVAAAPAIVPTSTLVLAPRQARACAACP